MFASGKIAWFLSNPQTLAFVLLLLGTALLFGRRWRLGRAVIALVIAAAGLLIVLPVGRWSMQLLEHRFPQPTLPGRIDGIILLGGEIDQELTLAYGVPSFGNGAGRILGFAALARRYP